MNKLKLQLPQNILLTIYSSLILSQLITVYLPGAMSQNIYINFQHGSLELLINGFHIPGTNPLFKKLKILKDHDILHLNQVKFYNK